VLGWGGCSICAALRCGWEASGRRHRNPNGPSSSSLHPTNHPSSSIASSISHSPPPHRPSTSRALLHLPALLALTRPSLRPYPLTPPEELDGIISTYPWAACAHSLTQQSPPSFPTLVEPPVRYPDRRERKKKEDSPSQRGSTTQHRRPPWFKNALQRAGNRGRR
jgi:hypothetical protein